jgi:hypothetical protein
MRPKQVVVDGVEISVQYDNVTMIACFDLEAPKKLPFTFLFDEERKIDIFWHS